MVSSFFLIGGFLERLCNPVHSALRKPEKREALERWANHLLVEVAKATGGNVVTLGKA
jgi:hypothetical protein